MNTALPAAIRGGTPAENAATLRSILRGEKKGPLRDVVLLNAGAALVAADIARDIADGIQRAADSIDSGEATKRMTAFVELSASLG